MTCDVVVIGGGVIGTSIAYNLSKRNTDVILVEKNDVASGTSGSCDGFVFMQSKKAGIHLEMALESAKIMEQLPSELQRDIEYEKSGGMILIESKEDLSEMRDFVQQQRKTGLDVILLDSRQSHEMEPNLSPDIAGATYSPTDAHLNPLLLCLGFAEAAKSIGAKILTDTEVIGIDIMNGKVQGVITTKGKIKASIIVNAAGVYAPDIANLAGINLPIIPRRGQIAVTEPIPKFLEKVMICNKYIKSKFNPDQSHDSLGIGLALEQTKAGNVLIGSTREFVGYNRHVTPEGIQAILKYAQRFVPAIGKLNVIRTFAGLRPYTPYSLPILGKVNGIEGFIVSAGHEGDGVALSPITGVIITELITTGKSDLLAHLPVRVAPH
jgi:glycine/D-amino acid oxidase-like deaminating enzyme